MSDVAGVVVLGAASRELRRALRPIEWVVLEDVALDARPDAAGALVASTSARRVAEHLGLTPGAVARALARLRSEGLVTHVRQPGDAGRFGLSAYVLAPVPGLDVVDTPRAPDAGPGAVAPRAVPPHVEGPGVADAHVAGAGVSGGADRRDARRRRSDDRPGGAPAVDARPVAAGRSGHDGGRSARRRDRAQPPPAAQLSILDADPLRPSP